MILTFLTFRNNSLLFQAAAMGDLEREGYSKLWSVEAGGCVEAITVPAVPSWTAS